MTRMLSIAASLLMAIGVRCSNDGGTKPDDPEVERTGEIGDPCPNGNEECTKGLGCAGRDAGEAYCYKACTPLEDSECGDPTKFGCGADGECHPR
ncbi:MAG: hypothetical protein ABIP39_07540 [Polyangiaceae bacterium]